MRTCSHVMSLKQNIISKNYNNLNYSRKRKEKPNLAATIKDYADQHKNLL